MTVVDREQLKRGCSDALGAHLRDQRVVGLAELADAPGSRAPYSFHGELVHEALWDGQEIAITWHLIRVPVEFATLVLLYECFPGGEAGGAFETRGYGRVRGIWRSHATRRRSRRAAIRATAR